MAYNKNNIITKDNLGLYIKKRHENNHFVTGERQRVNQCRTRSSIMIDWLQDSAKFSKFFAAALFFRLNFHIDTLLNSN